MKFGNLIHNGLSRGKDARIVNLGDAFEIIAIDEIYDRMGITKANVIDIDLYELDKYEGEPVILPINFMIAPEPIMGINMLNMSSKIIPVFLGVTFTQTDFTKEQIAFLKRSEPIGCRDERTKNSLLANGISAYVGGCIVTTIHRKMKFKKDKKVAFIDVPKAIEKYIPKDIINNCEIMDHEFVVSYEEVLKDNSLKNKGKQRIEYYMENIELIVTSRFHGAVIGLALGIPVILVAENNFYKFSWLSKLLPFYEIDKMQEINWNPSVINVDEIKNNMLKIAISRISNAYAVHSLVYDLDKQLSNKLRSDAPALLYASGAIDFISDNWNTVDKICYGFWGINKNAEHIYQFIVNNYPNAILQKVYDGLRNVTFFGIESERPNEETMDVVSFIFVTSNTAARVAEDLFHKINKKNYYLCQLEFIRR